MIILPIEHDHTIRRIPWVTIAIMIACLLVQLHRTIFAPQPSEYIDAEHEVTNANKTLMLSLMHRAEPQPQPTMTVMDSYDEAPPPDPFNDHESPTMNAPPGVSPQAPVAAAPIAKDPLVIALQNGKTLDQIIANMHTDKLGTDADPAVARVHDAMKRAQALDKKDIAGLFVYEPQRGAFSITMMLAAFAHEGWLHLADNLIFLWLYCCNLEDRWGHAAFAAFYALATVASNVAFILLHHHDHTNTLGTSNTIANAMDAFLVCFARARIKWIYIVWFRPNFFYSSALIAFPIWFLAQAAQMIFETSGMPRAVAYSAHVNGFAFGLVFADELKLTGLDEKLQKLSENDDEKGWEEHPDFVKALPLVESDPGAAVPLLHKVLVDRPTHDEARLSLAHATTRTSNDDLLSEVLPRTVTRLSTDER